MGLSCSGGVGNDDMKRGYESLDSRVVRSMWPGKGFWESGGDATNVNTSQRTEQLMYLDIDVYRLHGARSTLHMNCEGSTWCFPATYQMGTLELFHSHIHKEVEAALTFLSDKLNVDNVGTAKPPPFHTIASLVGPNLKPVSSQSRSPGRDRSRDEYLTKG